MPFQWHTLLSRKTCHVLRKLFFLYKKLLLFRKEALSLSKMCRVSQRRRYCFQQDKKSCIRETQEAPDFMRYFENDALRIQSWVLAFSSNFYTEDHQDTAGYFTWVQCQTTTKLWCHLEPNNVSQDGCRDLQQHHQRCRRYRYFWTPFASCFPYNYTWYDPVSYTLRNYQVMNYWLTHILTEFSLLDGYTGYTRKPIAFSLVAISSR